MMLVAPFVGCAAKPPERPIVLRPRHPERRLARRPRTSPATATPPAEAPVESPVESMSPGEKENLFRDFDAYLSHTGKP